MYPANSTDYKKFSDSPPTSAPPPTTGIPVNASNQYYSSDASIPQGHPQIPIQPKTPQPWSTGLCDCFSDVSNCCITCWCPCITFGQVAEIIDKGSTSCGASGALYTLIALVTGCTPCYSCFYRSKMRQQYALHESPCNDCLVHCFCESCALCQEYRELKSRGFDMSVGWHGNVERQNHGVAMTPVVQEQGMSR